MVYRPPHYLALYGFRPETRDAIDQTPSGILQIVMLDVAEPPNGTIELDGAREMRSAQAASRSLQTDSAALSRIREEAMDAGPKQTSETCCM